MKVRYNLIGVIESRIDWVEGSTVDHDYAEFVLKCNEDNMLQMFYCIVRGKEAHDVFQKVRRNMIVSIRAKNWYGKPVIFEQTMKNSSCIEVLEMCVVHDLHKNY